MKTRYRSPFLLVLRNLIRQLLPARVAHWINVIKNLRFNFLDPEMPLLRTYIEEIRRIKGSSLCLDVGANIGIYTQLFLDAGSRVVAFEPQGKLCKYLAKCFGKKIELYNFGLSDKDSEIVLRIPRLSRLLGPLGVVDALATTVETAPLNDHGLKGEKDNRIVVKRLDQVEIEGAIHLLKIDVEGGECKVLRGGRSQIQRHKPLIFCEVANENTLEFATLLAELDYESWYFHRQQARLIQVSEELDSEILRHCSGNVICLPRNHDTKTIFKRVVDSTNFI
jgi:FkbM family methyltransferase